VQNLHPNLDLGTKTQELISSSKGAKPPRAGGAADGPLSSIEESQSQTPAPITATGTMLPSEDTAQVLTAMRRFFRPSQAVVEKLIAECRERNPAATMEEISRAIVDAGSSCSRNVRSIAGVIIKQAPLLLEGDAYRLEKQKHEEARRHNEEADEEAARQEEKSEQSAAQHEQELLEAKDRLRERERAKHRRETQDPTKTPWWKAREWSSKEYRGSRFDRAIAPLIFDRWERGTMFLWAPSLEVLGAAARLHQEIEDATRVVKGHHVEVKIFCDEASR
jgi:vacuolar-type H+-ATPase subunit H